MGDTGSLSLGGALGAIAVLTKHEIVWAIIGGVFVAEALSVIIQVFWFKRTGQRVFLMAPIHHVLNPFVLFSLGVLLPKALTLKLKSLLLSNISATNATLLPYKPSFPALLVFSTLMDE